MFLQDFHSQISDQIIEDEPLSKHTTIGIGGPAKFFYVCSSIEELRKILILVRKYNIKIFIIGSGSNVIISDDGFDGLVLDLRFKDIEILDKQTTSSQVDVKARHASLPNSYYSTDLPNSFSATTQPVRVKIGSSWKILPLIIKLHESGITGLEWFSGIPASLGGAVYMNIHGGKYFFSDFIFGVETLTLDGQIQTHLAADLKFDYDYSYFHQNKEIILNIILNLYRGNVSNGKNIIKDWGVKKNENQPQRSAGCVWQNLDENTQIKLGLPTPSIGYIIDQVLGLKGTRKGDAIISDKHSAFIENTGNASFSDALHLIKLVETEFQKKYGLKLEREIEIIK